MQTEVAMQTVHCCATSTSYEGSELRHGIHEVLEDGVP
jgi:fructoselysine-6-P-deglycase FrlB-like protein